MSNHLKFYCKLFILILFHKIAIFDEDFDKIKGIGRLINLQ